MAYTIEQIKVLINPYEEFKEEGVFAENAELLEELNTEEKIIFAHKVFLHCPPEELSTFTYEIESLRNQKTQKINKSTSIHDIMREAFTATKLVLSLTDPKNTNIDDIIKNEFDPDLFQKHSKLVIEIVEATPVEKILILLLRIKKLTLEKELIDSLNSKLTFKLKASILLSDNPGKFFDEDADLVDECNEHSDLLIKLIHGHENKIGKLIAEKNPDQCTSIFKILERITPKTQDQNSPLRLIHSAMVMQLELNNIKQTPSTIEKTDEIIKESDPVDTVPNEAEKLHDEIKFFTETDCFDKNGAPIDSGQVSPRLTEVIEPFAPQTPKMQESLENKIDELISGPILVKDLPTDEFKSFTATDGSDRSGSPIDSGQVTPREEVIEPVVPLTPKTEATLNSLLSPQKPPETKSGQLKTGSGISFFDQSDKPISEKDLPTVETACCAKSCSIL